MVESRGGEGRRGATEQGESGCGAVGRVDAEKECVPEEAARALGSRTRGSVSGHIDELSIKPII